MASSFRSDPITRSMGEQCSRADTEVGSRVEDEHFDNRSVCSEMDHADYDTRPSRGISSMQNRCQSETALNRGMVRNQELRHLESDGC